MTRCFQDYGITRGLVRMHFIAPEDVVLKAPKTARIGKKGAVKTDADSLKEKGDKGRAKQRKSYEVDV